MQQCLPRREKWKFSLLHLVKSNFICLYCEDTINISVIKYRARANFYKIISWRPFINLESQNLFGNFRSSTKIFLHFLCRLRRKVVFAKTKTNDTWREKCFYSAYHKTVKLFSRAEWQSLQLKCLFSLPKQAWKDRTFRNF